MARRKELLSRAGRAQCTVACVPRRTCGRPPWAEIDVDGSLLLVMDMRLVICPNRLSIPTSDV